MHNVRKKCSCHDPFKQNNVPRKCYNLLTLHNQVNQKCHCDSKDSLVDVVPNLKLLQTDRVRIPKLLLLPLKPPRYPKATNKINMKITLAGFTGNLQIFFLYSILLLNMMTPGTRGYVICNDIKNCWMRIKLHQSSTLIRNKICLEDVNIIVFKRYWLLLSKTVLNYISQCCTLDLYY